MALELRSVGAAQCTALGFGGAFLGDLLTSISDEAAIEAVRAAVAAGVRYFDTAPWYGLGLSESRVGLALRSSAPGALSLSTKVGRSLEPVAERARWKDRGWPHGLQMDVVWDFTYEGVMRQHRDSLQRLGLGSVDCLVIHDMEEAERDVPSGVTTTAHPGTLLREQLRGGVRALEELRRGGLIKAYGVGLNGAEGREEAAYRKWNREYLDYVLGLASPGERPVDFVLMAGNHTLLTHTAHLDGLLRTCEDRGIAIVIGGALQSGILATGATKGATFDYAPASEENLERVRKLEAVCAAHRVSLPAAALQYPLGHPSVATVIVGVRSAFEVERAKASMEEAIPGAFWEQLLNEGLLPKGAPAPSSEPAAKRARQG